MLRGKTWVAAPKRPRIYLHTICLIAQPTLTCLLPVKPKRTCGLASSQTTLHQAASQPEEDTLFTENQAGAGSDLPSKAGEQVPQSQLEK